MDKIAIFTGLYVAFVASLIVCIFYELGVWAL